MKQKYLSLLTFLLFTSLFFLNTASANDERNVIDANQYVAQNQKLPDIELSNNMKSFEFEKNKTVEMDSVFFDDLLSIKVDKNYEQESDIDTNSSAILLPKVITMTYNSSNFPPTVEYTEYTKGRWYKGDLSFKSAELINGKYVATYSGFLIAQPS